MTSLRSHALLERFHMGAPAFPVVCNLRCMIETNSQNEFR